MRKLTEMCEGVAIYKERGLNLAVKMCTMHDRVVLYARLPVIIGLRPFITNYVLPTLR